jgi:putative restriction endonuclease
MANVLPLSKTHHAAFDRGLFTLDEEYRLRVNPAFETESQLLQRTIIEQDGTQIQLADGAVSASYLTEHNENLSWV